MCGDAITLNKVKITVSDTMLISSINLPIVTRGGDTVMSLKSLLVGITYTIADVALNNIDLKISYMHMDAVTRVLTLLSDSSTILRYDDRTYYLKYEDRILGYILVDASGLLHIYKFKKI